MSKKRQDQQDALALLSSWGFRCIPVGRHYVVATGPGIVWCVPGILTHAVDKKTPATFCPKHNPTP